MVSRKKERIRFSRSLFFSFLLSGSMVVVEIGVLFRAQTLLVASDGRRRRRSRKKEDEHVKTRNMCVYVQTHQHTIALFFLSIHLSLSFSNMYKNKFDRPYDYIINPKLVSVLFFLSHPLFFGVCRVRIGQ